MYASLPYLYLNVSQKGARWRNISAKAMQLRTPPFGDLAHNLQQRDTILVIRSLRRLPLCICLSVCLSVCLQDNPKSCRRSWMKCFRGVGCVIIGITMSGVAFQFPTSRSATTLETICRLCVCLSVCMSFQFTKYYSKEAIAKRHQIWYTR